MSVVAEEDVLELDVAVHDPGRVHEGQRRAHVVVPAGDLPLLQPAGLRQAAISFPTVAGTIASAWKVDEGRTDWTLTVPDGTEAIIYVSEDDWIEEAVPAEAGAASAAYGNIQTQSLPDSARVTDPALDRPGRKAYRCGPGTHRFLVRPIPVERR